MPATSTTYNLISAYAGQEPWKRDHDGAMLCRDLEETIAWGINLFRGLNEMEEWLQSGGIEGRNGLHSLDQDEFERAYRLWVKASEAIVRFAEELAHQGLSINGLEKFRAINEEARCQVELWDFEPELRPIEETRALIRPDNPRPDRYGA
jgi:hypothetical protein